MSLKVCPALHRCCAAHFPPLLPTRARRCAAVLVHWCKGWFDYFPNVPVAIMARLTDALASAGLPSWGNFVISYFTENL